MAKARKGTNAPKTFPNGMSRKHMKIALACKEHFICQFPIISKALGWCSDECKCSDEDYYNDLQPCLRID